MGVTGSKEVHLNPSEIEVASHIHSTAFIITSSLMSRQYKVTALNE
jgi:hypothetical protein